MTVSGLEKAGIVRKIEITKHINKHSLCKVELLLTDKEQWRQLQMMMGKEVLVEDEQYIYMRGTVKSIHIDTAFSKSVAVIEIISLSEKTDKKKKNRIFQHTQKTYNDIFSCVPNKCDAKIQITDKEFSSQAESKTIVQYNETDFSFITKTANKNGYYVFVNDTDRTCIFNIGKSGSNVRKKVDENDIIYLSYDIESTGESLELKLHSYCEFGSCIELENQVYTIISVNIVFMNGETSYSYKAYRETVAKCGKEETGEIFYVGLAKVVKNEDPENLGRIQAEFLDFEDSLPSDRTWITYLCTFTEDSGGVIFIPDAGETIHVFVENGICYADGCVRKTAINDQLQNIKNRTICVRNKLFKFSDEQIELTGFGYNIEVNEKGLYVSGETIKIDAEEDKVRVRCGDSRITMDKNSIDFQSKSEAVIKADRIRLDGSSKISAKTSSFDVG